MTPTIERRDTGWYVLNVRDGRGRLVNVGPFTTAGNAAAWIALNAWGL